MVIGLGAMIKISPLLLVGLFVWQRRWKAVGGVLLSIGGLTLLTWAIAGTDNLIAFVTQGLGETIGSEVTNLNNVAPAALIHRLLSFFGWVSWEPLAQQVWIGLCLLVLSLFSLKQHAPDEPAFTILFALWVTATLLISPLTWQHHLVMLLLAFGVLLALYLSYAEHFSLWFAIGLGWLYTSTAFENLILTRFGDWGVAHGSYWHDYLFVDLRLFAIGGVFLALLYMLRRIASLQMVPIQAAPNL
jgi:hypothetical protein